MPLVTRLYMHFEPHVWLWAAQLYTVCLSLETFPNMATALPTCVFYGYLYVLVHMRLHVYSLFPTV